MIKLIAGAFIFLACLPQVFMGCTMTEKQVQAVSDAAGYVGKTTAEILKILGPAMAESIISTRGDSNEPSGLILKYPDFNLVVKDGVVVGQIYHTMKKDVSE